MTSLYRSSVFFLALGLLVSSTYSLLQGCSPEPRYKKLKVGEKITILPSDPKAALALSEQKHEVVRLGIKWGERPISIDKGEPTLRFYDREGKLRYEYTWTRLASAYRDTNCDATEVAYLDGYLAGEALICDGSLDLKQISMIEGEIAGSPKRRATSWGWYALGPDAVAVSIGLFQ